MFEHCAWHFYEISFYICSRKSCIISFVTHVVHDVSEFMEKCYNIFIVNSMRFSFLLFFKICHKHGHTWRKLTINQWSSLNTMSWWWYRNIPSFDYIHIKVPHQVSRHFIPYLIARYIRMPNISSFQLPELKSKHSFLYFHYILFHMINRKIFLYLFIINLECFIKKKHLVISSIPLVKNLWLVFGFFSHELCQDFTLFLCFRFDFY